SVIDTGGYVIASDDVYEAEIRKQVKVAIDEASVILFVVDCIDGMTGVDEDFAKELRGTEKPILIVANTSDKPERLLAASEFYLRGLGNNEVFPIPATSGSGTGELLDEIIKHFEDEGEEDPEAGIPKIAILGRPNVGKSSYL